METIEQHHADGLRLTIWQDESCPWNPREDNPLGTIVSFDIKERDVCDEFFEMIELWIGDQLEPSELDWCYFAAAGHYPEEDDAHDCEPLDAIDVLADPAVFTVACNFLDARMVVLPLYRRYHGGMDVGAPGISGEMGRSQVGYVYVTMDGLRNETKTPCMDSDLEGLRAWGLEVLTSEIELYSQWVTGDVYGFTLERHCDDCDCEDPESCDNYEDTDDGSCGGFFGSDWGRNGLADHLGEYRYLLDPEKIRHAA